MKYKNMVNGSPKPEFETDEDRSYFITRLFIHDKFVDNSDEEPKRSRKSYLVSMFRNYWMAAMKLTGEERKKKIQQMIIKRFRQELRNAEQKLRCKDWIVFHLFGWMPDLFVNIYQIAQDIKKR